MVDFDGEEDSGVVKIADLNQYSRQINVIAKVISKTDIREVVTRTDETTHRVCEALVADDTGAIYLTLWDDAIDNVAEGQVLGIKNGYMNTFRGSMRLNIGRYGSFEPLEDGAIRGRQPREQPLKQAGRVRQPQEQLRSGKQQGLRPEKVLARFTHFLLVSSFASRVHPLSPGGV